MEGSLMVNFLPKKKKQSKKMPLLLILAVGVFVFWFYYQSSLNDSVSKSTEVVEFNIEPGWGSTKISEELKKIDLIKNRYIFQFYVWRQGIDSRLQSGQYFLAKNLNIKEIAQILTRGSGQTREATLRFIEGWNNSNYAVYLQEQGFVTEQEFFDVIQKKAPWWDNHRILDSKPKNLDLEGYLFPDTYRVFRDSSIAELVEKMLSHLESKFTPQMLSDIEKQGRNVHEILTMASILEKEVTSDEDRKMVADIFYKRLKAGIALQSDATVNYATGKSVSRASAADLEVDSLYNTYKYRGLPPGPIANPSLSAIIAAIYPKPNSYYYFLTTPDGEVIYNIDFDGHVKDKNKYY